MGAPEAVLSPDEAADQLIATIESLNQEHSGMFLNHDGTPHPGKWRRPYETTWLQANVPVHIYRG